MVLQGRDGLVQPELFVIVGADRTVARDTDVLAGRIAETILGIRDFSKLSDLVGSSEGRTPKLALVLGEAAHRPYADLSAIGSGQEAPANLFYKLLYLFDIHISFPFALPWIYVMP